MPKVFQSAGTNAKQKKVQGLIPKLGKNTGTKHTFKPTFNYFCWEKNMYNKDIE